MRILLVDDNPDDRALVRRALIPDHPGCQFAEADTPAALEQALADPPDLAILDYSLGWSNGVAVFHRLKAANPDVSAILFTGSLGEERAVEIMREGLGDYILKDVSRLPRLRASALALLEQQRERRARRRAEERYRDLFQRVSVGLFACDADGQIANANPALLSLLAAERPETVRAMPLIALIGDVAARDALTGLKAGESVRCRSRLVRPDGLGRDVYIQARRIADGESGGAGCLEGEITDVTELQELLEQKNRLLREVVHRVYNNLQQITALLQLQATRCGSDEAQRALHDMSDRIRALSLVQRRLHHGDMQHVDFSGFLRDLAGLYQRSDLAIELDAEGDAQLEVAKAMPAALLVHELIANALRHACSGRADARIRLGLRRSGEMLEIEVADNGPGADPDLILKGPGVSSRIVTGLARQLDGQLTVHDDRGFAVLVRFTP